MHLPVSNNMIQTPLIYSGFGPGSDVWIYYNDTGSGNPGAAGGAWHGPLQPGYGGDEGRSEGVGSMEMGPELGLGWALGDGLKGEQVLLIKTAWGGKSLHTDFRPPSSGGTVGPFFSRMVGEVKDVLSNLKTLFPSAPPTFELAGFMWHQGSYQG